MRLRKRPWSVFVLGVVITTGLAAAGPKPGWVRYYYGDDHTQVVGARGTDCYGEPVSWGIATDDSTLIYTCID